MQDYHSSTNNQEPLTWNARVRDVLSHRRPMSLSAMLDKIAETNSFDGCQDPLHNLRGVCAQGVKKGWLKRVSPGVYQLASVGSRRTPRVTSPKASAPPPLVLKRTASRTGQALQITIGEVTLTTPPGMEAEALARIVKAIRAVSN